MFGLICKCNEGVGEQKYQKMIILDIYEVAKLFVVRAKLAKLKY